MLARIESRTDRSSSRSGARGRRPRRVAAITQILLFVAFGAAVLVALFFDSRFYYGIDLDGQPIHKENRRTSGQGIEICPVSTDSAVGSHDFDDQLSSHDATSLKAPLLDRLRDADQVWSDTAEAHG